MKNASNWRQVRLIETRIECELHARHRLRIHGWAIGLLVLGVMWAVAHLQMVLGFHSLAMRYVATLGAGYLVYLLVLRIWAGMLLREQGAGDVLDVADLPSPGGGTGGSPTFSSGGGGDFAGGGASGDFGGPDGAGDVVGEFASNAVEAAASADEAAVVVVPVVAIFAAAVLALLGAGSLLLLYFGFDALLAVAVELAFAWVGARTISRVGRDGWITAAVRLTWKPLLGALACAVLLGGLVDYLVPSAKSLPDAVRMVKAH